MKLKLLEKNKGKTLQDVGIGSDFFFFWIRSQRTGNKKHWQMDYIRQRNFFVAKKINTLRGKCIEWGKVFARYSSDQRLISRPYQDIEGLVV
jgi:hypothetical protein